jgi:hypothetical protein
MRPFLGSKLAWPIVRATMTAAVLAVWMALAPGASAHSQIHDFAAMGSPHQDAVPSVSRDATAITTAYFLRVGSMAVNEHCPEPGHDRADHIGCCAGMASCVSGCGAMMVPEEGPSLPAGKAILPVSTMPVSTGVKILPSDPPPRASI